MKMLALEFSSAERSVAAVTGARAQPQVACEVVETATRQDLKPFGMIEAVLRAAGWEREQIEGVVVGLGPGSYTGIRAAIAMAQGWQLGTGAKVMGASSAAAVAAQARRDGLAGGICVVIDAQRQEFYLADYEISDGEVREIVPLQLAVRQEVYARAAAGRQLAGPEVTRWFPEARLVFPRAARLVDPGVSSGEFVAAETLAPIYLRETSFVKAPPSRVDGPPKPS